MRIGPVEVERELGRGATGVVYAARDPVLGRRVAVKLIATLQPSQVLVWDAQQGTLRGVYPLANAPIVSAACTADGRVALGTEDGAFFLCRLGPPR